ncbi:serine hydrolase domain-containing protein [Xanthovirga aplysinae]|uniref:serine hydrolase domain-containing protein n=1 Tax=Xanthovirga aplysinae TaxID=2529853 RepID=UPI0012BC36BA|nr:serine hydrolase domain-containing protein [Xanthovirga aplysinae]MTI32152.1 class A beta-lactamase-related serine hydrolase [Xanthovirga aplysinae]
MRITFFGAFISIIGLVSCQKNEQKTGPTSSLLLVKLDSLINSENKENRFHGTVVIGNLDSIFYHKAIGVADRVWDLPMQLDYRFDIASVNKSFIAALILIAVEENKLQLDDKLTDLLTNYKYSGKFDPNITIHQMLTHTSGLADYNGVRKDLSANKFLKFKRLHFSNHDYLDFISQIPPFSNAGKQFHYSNFAYHLLAIILEDTYQQPFSEILDEKICKPLKLSHTFSPQSREEVHKKVTEAYNYSPQEKKWRRNRFIDLTLGRRIYSTSGDLYKWGKAMSNNSLLSESSLKVMQTNHLSHLGNNISYGYGWVIFDGRGQYKMGNLSINAPYIIHGGSTEGYKAMLVIIDKGKFIISLLANCGDQVNEIHLTQKIVQLLNSSIYED